MEASVQPELPEGPRAEELIATIYATLTLRRSEGCLPGKVFLAPENYRKIQDYRRRLGSMDCPGMDYLGTSHIFNLEIYIDESRDMTLI